MLVNVELAEHFRQESLKLSRHTYKVRLLLIIRTKQQQQKKHRNSTFRQVYLKNHSRFCQTLAAAA